MNTLLVSASLLLIMVGLVHSTLGEVMIFKKLRSSGILPNQAPAPLRARNIRIIWATWHLASVFGFAIAGILLLLVDFTTDLSSILNLIAWSMFAAAALVFYATNAGHPGWIGLLCVAVLCWLA